VACGRSWDCINMLLLIDIFQKLCEKCFRKLKFNEIL
jgi:hypothetical protein